MKIRIQFMLNFIAFILCINSAIAKDFELSEPLALDYYAKTAYDINQDGKSVTLVSASKYYWRSGSSPLSFNMERIVTNPDNGNEYIITALGSGSSELMLTETSITANISRVNNLALSKFTVPSSFNTSKMYISEDAEFDYIGVYSLNYINDGPLRIADNGVLCTTSYVPSKIILGKNVTLKSVNNIFSGTLGIGKKIEFYSYSENPPQIEAYTSPGIWGGYKSSYLFTNEDYYTSAYTTLYVPIGCKEAYSADPEWGRFENIVEMEPVALEEIISDESQGISISIDHGQIYVQSTEDREVLVFAMSGLLLKRDHTRDGGVTIDLQPGAYLVKVGDKFIRKVAVK